MPSKPRTPCSVPGCPELTTGGRCAEHKREANKDRASRGGAVYTTRWQRVRKAYIYKHPWCVLCAKAATVADHFPLSRRELEAKGDPNPDSPKHLRPLCTSCHNKETAKHQPGGWAHERGARSVTLNAYGRFADDGSSSR
jgi:5-methylcytosine-specific restriction protein A